MRGRSLFHLYMQILFTKVDLVSPAELQASLAATLRVIVNQKRSACLPFIHTLSTVDKTGIDHFKLAMAEIYGYQWGK